MSPNILQVLTQAIKDRRCVALRYHDQREIRVVEPHAIYTDDRSALVLDAYQVRGFSSSGRPVPFWRPFRLKEISAVQVVGETFMPRTTEGFSAARLKYKNGLVAIVQTSSAPRFAYPPATAAEMGPPRPQHLRR
ncbi:MAG: WYL domain-containing protein [Gammaproteobacteria bacterium]|nr:WYL domain-containing protein [Gammaproteobacteria bacterium]